MDSVFFKLLRDEYTTEYTMGNMFLNLEFFGHTLENPVRPPGVKVKFHTAINPGHYILQVGLDGSGREKVYINNVPLFTGVQCHGGNTVKDTWGCPLVAKNRYTGKIQGTLENKMIEIVKSVKYAYIEIINLNQLQP